jgi:hypothetical protein
MSPGCPDPTRCETESLTLPRRFAGPSTRDLGPPILTGPVLSTRPSAGEETSFPDFPLSRGAPVTRTKIAAKISDTPSPENL